MAKNIRTFMYEKVKNRKKDREGERQKRTTKVSKLISGHDSRSFEGRDPSLSLSVSVLSTHPWTVLQLSFSLSVFKCMP